MRVLITGGAGFIGSHIADAIVNDGHEVMVLDNLSTGKKANVPEGARFVEGDIRNRATVDGIFGDFRPDVVCHQAAQTSVSVSARDPLVDAEVNVLGTLHLLEATRRRSVQRFVFASTGGAMYGNVGPGQRATTEWLPNPLSPYGCSKLAGEAYVRTYGAEHGLAHVVLRYANVYGPRQDPHGEAGVVAIFTQRVLAHAGIRINACKEEGDPGCIRDYVYVQDVVAANRAAIVGQLDRSLLNVATGVPTTTLDLARLIERAAGKPASIDFGPRRAGDLESSVLEPDRDLNPRWTLADGIEATVRWFAETYPS